MKKNPKKNKNKTLLYGGIGLIAAVIIILTVTTGNKPAETLTEAAANEGIVIDKASITKTASIFPYESNGTYMEIIAVRANDDSVRTALNTCQVCYNSGRGYYEQLGDKLICNNCGNQFTIDQIEIIKGGCNPVPIVDEMKNEDDETITIDPESLVAYEPLFANWKK